MSSFARQFRNTSLLTVALLAGTAARAQQSSFTPINPDGTQGASIPLVPGRVNVIDAPAQPVRPSRPANDVSASGRYKLEIRTNGVFHTDGPTDGVVDVRGTAAQPTATGPANITDGQVVDITQPHWRPIRLKVGKWEYEYGHMVGVPKQKSHGTWICGKDGTAHWQSNGKLYTVTVNQWKRDVPPTAPVATAAPLPAEAPAPVERIVPEVHDHETIKYVNSYQPIPNIGLARIQAELVAQVAIPGSHWRSPVKGVVATMSVIPYAAPCPWLLIFGGGGVLQWPRQTNDLNPEQFKLLAEYQAHMPGYTKEQVNKGFSDLSTAIKDEDTAIKKDRKKGQTVSDDEVDKRYTQKIAGLMETNRVVYDMVFWEDNTWAPGAVERLRVAANTSQAANENPQLPTPRTAADAPAGVLTPSAGLAEPPAPPEQPFVRRLLEKPKPCLGTDCQDEQAKRDAERNAAQHVGPQSSVEFLKDSDILSLSPGSSAGRVIAWMKGGRGVVAHMAEGPLQPGKNFVALAQVREPAFA